ncbi:MAG: DUF3754 domain-containing protein [Pseudomonadota bacterium]
MSTASWGNHRGGDNADQGTVLDTDVVASTADVAPQDRIGGEIRPASAPTAPTSGEPAGSAHDGQLETFIPVTRMALFERLTAPGTWSLEQRDDAVRLFRYLAAWRHQTYMERLMALKEGYLPFSPDRDTVRTEGERAQGSSHQAEHDAFISEMVTLLTQANYNPIDREQLDRIFAEDSAYGLDLTVDLNEFEDVMLFYRGASFRILRDRTWRKLWLGFEERSVPSYRRLFILLKLKTADVRVSELMQSKRISRKKAERTVRKARRQLPDGVSADFVYLKLFKDIPRADVRMLFPNTVVRFRLMDKLKLGLTAGGGTLASIVTTVTKVVAAVNPITAVMALVTLIGVVWRQVMKFFNQRNQYMMVLAQNLYFHTLADNRGVLTLLTDRAEEEDIKEEMLIYTLLAKEEIHVSQLEDARHAIEQYLLEEFNVGVRFDLYDGLQRLEADGLVVKRADGMLVAMPPREGCAHIDAMWDRYLDDSPFFQTPTGERSPGPAPVQEPGDIYMAAANGASDPAQSPAAHSPAAHDQGWQDHNPASTTDHAVEHDPARSGTGRLSDALARNAAATPASALDGEVLEPLHRRSGQPAAPAASPVGSHVAHGNEATASEVQAANLATPDPDDAPFGNQPKRTPREVG